MPWQTQTGEHKTPSCISSSNRRRRYLLKAGGLWAQQNLSWTWSNREPQTMPIIIVAVLSCGYIHPSSSARRILQDFPFEWEIDSDLSSLFVCVRLLDSVLWTPTMQLQSPLVHLSLCCGCWEPQSFLLFCQVARTTVKWRDVSCRHLQFPG